MKTRSFKNKKLVDRLSNLLDFLKIIAEENRLKILFVLKNGERCVCDIWQFLKLPQNLVSHHLGVLKDFGLVSARKEGLKIFYKLNKRVIKKYLTLVNGFLDSHGE